MIGHKDEKRIVVRAVEVLDDLTAYIASGVLIVLFVFTLWTMADLAAFNSHGAEASAGQDLEELRRINPDTVAWLRMDGTRIDYPVVRGKDNFEYLDLDIKREFYVGGTLFLDSGNKKDLSDKYNVIHGHHMADGLMFGDLDRYLENGFLDEPRRGEIETPVGTYALNVFAAGKANAYDTGIYSTEADMKTHIRAIRKVAKYLSEPETEADKILVLSTCTEEMDDSRTVVFCSMDKRHSGRSGR